ADADRIRTDSRYWHQWLLHNLQTKTGPKAAAARILNNPDVVSPLASTVQTAATHGKPQPSASASAPQDWGTSLGNGGMVGNGMFPAKFNFDVSAPLTYPASCTNDFAVYNTSLPGATSATKASQTGTFTAALPTGSTVTVNGTQLTASPGTGAKQDTIISSNSLVGG